MLAAMGFCSTCPFIQKSRLKVRHLPETYNPQDRGKITREIGETDTMAVEDFCLNVVLRSHSIGQSPLCMG